MMGESRQRVEFPQLHGVVAGSWPALAIAAHGLGPEQEQAAVC